MKGNGQLRVMAKRLVKFLKFSIYSNSLNILWMSLIPVIYLAVQITYRIGLRCASHV